MKKSWFLLILPAVASAVMLAVTLPHGVGIAPDSASYFSITHHISAGKGVSAYYNLYAYQSEPMAAWPPVYPAVLAVGMMLTRVSETAVAWILNLLFLGLNLWLAGKIVTRATRSVPAGVAAQALLVLTPEWRFYFVWALSEPMFLLTVNGALLACWKFIETARVRWFVAAALLAGFSALVRYIGGVYVAAFALALAVAGRGRLPERLRAAFNFGLLSAVPLAVWSVRNNLRMHEVERMSGTWMDRLFGSLMHYDAHANGWIGNLRSGWDACGGWTRDLIGPSASGGWAVWLTAAAGIAAVITVARVALTRARGGRVSPAATAAFLFFICGGVYFLGLAGGLTVSRFGVEIPLRYEIPTFTHMILAVVILLLAVPEGPTKKLAGTVGRTVVFISIIAWAVIGIPGTRASLDEMMRKGVDGSSGRRLTQIRHIQWFPTEASIAEFRMNRLAEEQAKGRSF